MTTMKSELSVYRDKDGSCSIWRGDKVIASGLSDDDALAMAAAPKLLEAIYEAQAAVTYLLSNDDNGGAYNALEVIEAAIAAAEGRD